MLDRVPFEIFQKIIKLSLDTYGTQFRDSGSDGVGSRPPIKMSHVCRAWRTTLLSDPTLWTCLNVPRMKADQLEEFLRRSGSIPLSVFLSFTYATIFDLTTQWYGNLSTTLALVLQEMHRIQTLEFIVIYNSHLSMENVVRKLLQYLKQPAPMLQTLYIGPECWTENAGALQTLFSGHTPHLKNIHYQVIVNFQELSFSPLLQNLSSLHLHLRPSVIIDRDILLNVLELSPCLRVFELILSENFEIAPRMLRSNCRVHLPRLQLLTLRGLYMTTLANFVLEHLTFPLESVRYSIEWCSDFQRRMSDSTPLIQFLAQRRHTSLSLSVVSTYLKHFQIHLDLFETYPHETGCSTFMTTYDPRYDPVDEFPIFLQTFKLSHIVHLDLAGTPLKIDVLRDVFTLLVNLEHLVVKHHSIHSPSTSSQPISFLLALLPQGSNFQAQAPGLGQKTKNELDSKQGITELDNNNKTSSFIDFPCPSLSTLKIVFLSGDGPKLDKRYAQAIATCCSARRRAGHPFTSISIHRLPESLTQEAETLLLRNEDCPINILGNSGK